MSLRKYCAGRLVVLGLNATAADAARAMDANHVGAVLVAGAQRRPVGILTDRDLALRVVGPGFPARRMRLSSLMSRHPVTIDVNESEAAAAELMLGLRVRRLVVLDEARVVGIVTLDDLMLSRAVPRTKIAAIVKAQLTEPSPLKPAGLARPARWGRGLTRPALRHEAHRDQTMRRFSRRLAGRLGLESERDAVLAFEVVIGQLLRRLTPSEAKDLLAQLPSRVREHLAAQPKGPDRRVTRSLIEEQVAANLGVGIDRAATLVRRAGAALGDFVSAGELDDVCSQLPPELEPLLRGAA